MSQISSNLPVAVIGAGPVGLAAAAHLLERGLQPLILEAGPTAAATVQSWGQVRLFSPWRYNIDAAARRLLTAAGWAAPDQDELPTGQELADRYLLPLSRLPRLAGALRTSTRVTAVTRLGLDKTRSAGRSDAPFLVRTEGPQGGLADYTVRAVIDASGTWQTPNPLGQAGLTAPGEQAARDAGFITQPLPDVLGADSRLFAGKHVLVVGAGHSAANTVLALHQLTVDAPGTRISWSVRGAAPEALYGGGDLDGLPARGELGTRLRGLVDAGALTLLTGFSITGFTGFTAASAPGGGTLTVQAETPAGPAALDVDVVVPATGFRPELGFLRELRLDLDASVEAPSGLGPLIDPEFHSCGTVEPHGAKLLAHPEEDFYIAGMKSYGRAPTFLMATGYEQVRSIAAALAGDRAAADRVELELPETGVCSVTPVASGSAEAPEASSCCSAPAEPQPLTLGIRTGLVHGRSGS